jgi:hypothetical protein
MTTEKSGFWIAAEELARQRETEWKRPSGGMGEGARSADFPF